MMNYDVFYLLGLMNTAKRFNKRLKKQESHHKSMWTVWLLVLRTSGNFWISHNDKFIRTTDDYHEKVVAQVFERLLAQDDIYLGEYSGWYSVSDEEFFTESQLSEVFRDEDGNVTGGIAPSGHQVEWVSEESYFLRLSKYQDRLVEFFKSHPDFITPDGRLNEMLKKLHRARFGRLSRVTHNLHLGVKVPSNPKHVVYVWMDALLNYVTALGYGQDEHASIKFWNGTVFHMVGKDPSLPLHLLANPPHDVEH